VRRTQPRKRQRALGSTPQTGRNEEKDVAAVLGNLGQWDGVVPGFRKVKGFLGCSDRHAQKIAKLARARADEGQGDEASEPVALSVVGSR
jgi:hypothetical protein